MPLYILKNEDEFNEIIFEQRLNVMIFTVCWSFGSKMILPKIFNLSLNQNLNSINFYRMDLDENNLDFIQRLNIKSIPTIQWYFHGNKLDELIGVDHEEFIHKTYRLANVKK